MSLCLGKVTCALLRERFGVVIEQIAQYLHSHGDSPLISIVKGTGLPLSKVKESLCVLIKYGLVSFAPNKNQNIANYKLRHAKVLLMLRYSRYIHIIKEKFGDESEIMLEEILQNGYGSMSKILLKAHLRLFKDHEKTVTFSELQEKFCSLITAKYICKIGVDKDEKPVPNMTLTDFEKYKHPETNIKLLADKAAGKIDNVKFPDHGIYWCINPDRFHQDMRDTLIMNAVAKRFDAEAGEVLRLLLQQMYIRTEPWANVTNPVPIVEVKDIVRKMNAYPNLLACFEEYLTIIEQDGCNVIFKAGEAIGGSYQINMKEFITVLAWETIEQIVLQKFGQKAARIFRLIKTKSYIEPDDIQKLAMIPAKDAKRFCYLLFEENFIHIQELRKPQAPGSAAKSFTLFHIQFPRVVRMVQELCYKSLYNMLMRKFNEKEENKRIIEKKQRVDAILLTMRAQNAPTEQIADMEEMITPPESEILTKIDVKLEKLNAVEFEIDNTLFILQLFLKYEVAGD